MSPAVIGLEQLAQEIDAQFPRLSEAELSIGLAVHRSMASGAPVDVDTLVEAVGLPAARIDELMSEWPGVYRGDDDRIIGFWGLAIGETSHRFRIGDVQLYTWCAWDALFLPEILGATADVVSKCPSTGTEVRLRISPNGVETAEPAGVVVSLLGPDHCDVEGDRVISTFCNHIHFHASREAGEGWAAEKKNDTFMLTLEEAFELGRLTNALRYGETLRVVVERISPSRG
ncbi:MAG: organomercurial lyase MerB [Gemmatimonadota bacterium]|nr:MAG: organomercurial lyase MerB [Gemmatimonadota bacterium]